MLNGNSIRLPRCESVGQYLEFTLSLLSKNVQRRAHTRSVFVEFVPGTGKTVVAINILAELLQNDLTAQYVSKNAALRDVYEQ
ncbi:hypothetical protein C8039_12285 [Halogeometricum sp. wsp3]|nr:hypothetical protein C8039_12285 [Halogeometricum sp. wsp3]